MSRPPFITYFLFGSAFIFSALAVWSYFNTKDFISRSIEVNAEVVELLRKNSGDGDTFAPIYVFIDQNNESHRIHSNISSDPPAYQVGESIKVLYPPENPKKATINSTFSLWGLAIIFSCVAIVEFIVGIGFWFHPKLLKRN